MRATAVACVLLVGCSGGQRAKPTATGKPSTTVVPTLGAGERHVIDGVTVEMVGAKVGPVMLRDAFDKEQPSKDAYLSVSVRLTNTDPAKKVDYRPWSYGPNARLHPPSVTDDRGNSYKFIDMGVSDVVGQVGRSASLYPGKPITDLLLFEPPVAAASTVTLRLPASAFGSSGHFAFRFPRP